MTTATSHFHDLGITISAGDIPEDQMSAVIAELSSTMDRLMKSVSERHGVELNAWVSYDGRRDCSREHTR